MSVATGEKTTPIQWHIKKSTQCLQHVIHDSHEFSHDLQSLVFQKINWWLNQIKEHCVVFYIQFF